MKRYVAELEKRYPLTVHRQYLSFAVARGAAGEGESVR
jgi:hypothetical protein